MVETSWGLAVAEDGRPAEAPSVLLEEPHQVSAAGSEVAEEDGISLILNMGRTTRCLRSPAVMD